MSGSKNIINSSLQEEKEVERQDQNLSQLEWQIFRKYQLFFPEYIIYIDFSYSCGAWWLWGEELGLLSSNQEFPSFWSRQNLKELAIFVKWKPERVARKVLP